MPVSTGTASDYADLLSRLRTFMSANGWTSLRWTGAEYIARGEGLGGTDEIFIGIDTQVDAGADWYNWRLNGMTGFDDAQAFNAQPGNIVLSAAANFPRVHLWNAPILYWFVVNGRRILVVAKVSTVYQVCYLGLIKPYLPPTALPYPLVVAGTSTASAGARWSTQHVTHSLGVTMPVCANASTVESDILSNPRSSCRFWHGEWHGVQHYYNSSTSYATRWKCLFPYASGSGYRYGRLRTNPLDAGYALTPVTLQFAHPSKNIFGELDGVYHISGFSNAAENIVTIAGVDHLVVQNVYRNSPSDFCAIRLE